MTVTSESDPPPPPLSVSDPEPDSSGIRLRDLALDLDATSEGLALASEARLVDESGVGRTFVVRDDDVPGGDLRCTGGKYD
jgi:hypothetical protein